MLDGTPEMGIITRVCTVSLAATPRTFKLRSLPTTMMNIRLSTGFAVIGSVLLVSCYPVNENPRQKPGAKPAEKIAAKPDPQAIKDKEALRKKGQEELAQNNPPENPNPSTQPTDVPRSSIVNGAVFYVAARARLPAALGERDIAFLIGCKRIKISQLVALAYRLSVRIDGRLFPLSSLATADWDVPIRLAISSWERPLLVLASINCRARSNSACDSSKASR